MAEEVVLQGMEKPAKIRNPLGVAGLMLITLGIYGFVWWYKINREMVDLGRVYQVDGLGDNPTTSLLAFVPGFLLIVPPYVSLYNGWQRGKRAQELILGRSEMNGWIFVVLLLFIAIAAYPYMQSEMNKVWEALRNSGVAGQIPQGEAAGAGVPQQAPAQAPQQPPQA